jgi:PPOX class probable F420-dependent enzyme
MLDWEWAVELLEAGRNYWVSTTSPDGRPHAMPVWGVWLEDGLRFSTSAASRKGRNLARDPRVVVHLESGDEVVILEGEVEKTTLDDALADAYEAKYEYRPSSGGGEEGPWYVLRPRVAYAWLEREYPRTATRFDFPGPTIRP